MLPSYRIRVAPMMDWTDRHCRYFLRQVNSRARLYTEMITTAALVHSDVPRHLDFSAEEHPVVASRAVAALQSALTLEFADGRLDVVPGGAAKRKPRPAAPAKRPAQDDLFE